MEGQFYAKAAAYIGAAIAMGVGLCPEERRADALIPQMSVRENIILVVQRTLSRFGIATWSFVTWMAKTAGDGVYPS